MKVQLLSFPGCPNAENARARLLQAFSALGLAASFEEVDVSGQQCAAVLRRWGSPTILVDGRDVAGETTADGNACRLYFSAVGLLSGVPSEGAIRDALSRAAAGAAIKSLD